MQRALTIGVAGHVDHGKTTLVRHLTGVDTDRLGEEKRRGISIELGFAPLVLPTRDEVGPLSVGLVDMPGHERFVRRMISGAAGIDAVLLVIAADEGVMPQGREHLAICELLGVRQGAVVLTKVDLADEFLLELVMEDVADLLAGTSFADAPILQFSASDPDHWRPKLLAELAEQATGWLDARSEARARRGRMPFRLPIDRSFVLPGRGTIVTGTAATGQLRIGDSLRVHPAGGLFRVRGLQRHGEAVEIAHAPSRLALDLAAAAIDEVPVGAVLATEDGLLETVRFDAWLHALPHLLRPLKVRQRALIHIGTTHVEAAITQLTGVTLPPGDSALVQIHLDRPLAVAAGEGFIVRSSTADPRHGQTIAGGQVLHPSVARHRLGDATVLAQLTALRDGDEEARISALIALARGRGLSEAELGQRLDLPPDVIERGLKTALARGRIRRFGRPPRYVAPDAVMLLEQRALAAVATSHREMPERAAVDEPELIRQVGDWLDSGLIAAIVAGLVRRGQLVRIGAGLAQPGFQATLVHARPEVHRALDAALAEETLAVPIGNALLEAVAARCDAPPAEIELACREAVDAGRMTRIQNGYLLPSTRLEATIDAIFRAFSEVERFSTGDLKQQLGLTRKHLIPFAEYLDARKITVRTPDGERRFRSKALAAWLAREEM